MLNKHLIVKTSPIATKENIIFFEDYRITILESRLFRIEKGEKENYVDNATQSIWYRNTPKVDFKKKISSNSIKITTDDVCLVVNKEYEKSYVLIDGKKVKLDNKENLLGTYRTLDSCDGFKRISLDKEFGDFVPNGEEIKLGFGVCSKNGVAVIDDSNSLLLLEDGFLHARNKEIDDYVFAYGKDYRAAVKALYLISGNVPLIPRFALGNWWSRYYAYTEKEYMQVLEGFSDHKIPLSVATIDMDWHYSKDIKDEFNLTKEEIENEEKYGGTSGWTGYSWNKHLFPDYKKFLKEIKKRDLKITLNLHPKSGIRWFEDMYEAMAKELGRDPKTKDVIRFDISSPEFINAYFKIIHKPYEKDGVDFWWIDWQQGTKSAMSGLDPLWALNHYHYLDINKNKNDGIILSRFCQTGAHRYPLGFSGDTTITWETLNIIPYFTLTSSNIGYTWWSHDIGGHFSGSQDSELYVRFVQFGLFNPIMRLHSTSNKALTKEPWFYDNGYGKIISDTLRLRHSFVPYIYSANYENHANGKALIEPLYYEYPNSNASYKYKNEYFFGPSLLVCPVTTKINKDGYSRTKAYIPSGKWTDIFTEEVYEGEKEISLLRTLDSVPVLAKEGSIIPLANDIDMNGTPLPTDLTIKIFSGNGIYDMYEDKDNESAITRFVSTHTNGVQIVNISIDGNINVIPQNRKLNIEFTNIFDADFVVKKNGKKIKVDCPPKIHPTVTISDINEGDEIEIIAKYNEESKLDYLKRNCLNIIKRQGGRTYPKEKMYNDIISASSIKEFVENVNKYETNKTFKEKILETV